MKKKQRDVTKSYPLKQFIEKIRRFADGLEKAGPFVIQIAGERIHVPKGAKVNIEHERGKDGEEIEFQIVWNNAAAKAIPKKKNK
ncbi:MAG: hypothetical protein RI911_493 [Candidatus Parcubacteria bacterium]|jgi:amphi-Trp domain-containing protein